MAEVVSQMPSSKPPLSDKYGQYFDGQAWKLIGGVDCPANLISARATIHNIAKRQGVAVRISCRSKENALYVQAILGEGKP